VRPEVIGKFKKKFIHHIRSRNRDLLASSTVSEPLCYRVSSNIVSFIIGLGGPILNYDATEGYSRAFEHRKKQSQHFPGAKRYCYDVYRSLRSLQNIYNFAICK
jgi:hypothetical protein